MALFFVTLVTLIGKKRETLISQFKLLFPIVIILMIS